MLQKEQKVLIHPYKQLKTATNVCKRCFKPIFNLNIGNLAGIPLLCETCFNDLNPHFRRSKFFGINIYWFYDYNEPFRNSLFLLKGCGDFEMREIFLSRVANLIGFRFHNHIVVPVPSFRGRDEIRGFNHVISIFEFLGLPMEECLMKTKDVKQADLSKTERSQISNILDIKNGQKLVGKRILLVDDVMTTGSTIKACIGLLKQYRPKSIDVLVLARVQRSYVRAFA